MLSVTPPSREAFIMNIIQCPRCPQKIQVDAGGWPYVFSQILVHLDRCSDLPHEEVRPIAEGVTQRLFGAHGESLRAS